MPLGQLVLPVLIRSCVTPLQHIGQLLVGPGVEVDGLDARDVRAHAAVDAGAADADEDADVPGGPAGVLVALAVGAAFVGLDFDELFEGGAVALRRVGDCWGAAGHGLGCGGEAPTSVSSV